MTHSTLKLICIGMLLIASVATTRAQDKEIISDETTTFIDVTRVASLPDTLQGPVAWGDYNNDGWEDMLVGAYRLFRNNKDGTFTEVSEQAGLAKRVFSEKDKKEILMPTVHAGCALWADYDNDGWLDIFVFSGAPDGAAVLRNNKNGTFTNITKECAMKSYKSTEGLAIADFNKDGFLDVYVANYEEGVGHGLQDAFLLNKKGRFVESTKEVGVYLQTPTCSRGASCADFNNDGNMDIYVSNYRLQPNILWLNNGKSFEDVAEKLGVAGGIALDGGERCNGHTLSSCWADFNNDGFLDIISANLAHPSPPVCSYSHPTQLYKNLGPPDYKFESILALTLDKPISHGVEYKETHAIVSCGDYDKDGLIDFYITACYPGQRGCLYKNIGNFNFMDVTKETNANSVDSWSVTWCDFDNDGNLDLALSDNKEEGKTRVKLMKNKGNNNSYLKARLEGKCCNRFCIGARIIVTTENEKENITQIREITHGNGKGHDQNPYTQFFGFGQYKGTVKVEARFPCGKKKVFEKQKLNALLVIKE